MSNNVERKPIILFFTMQQNILLTVAIPTYNRSNLLDLCLDHIRRQINDYSDVIELIVSDNHSDDGTETTVSKYINNGLKINYVKNRENLGAERNVIQCFNLAHGKYVLILGDDDFLLDGSLSKIITIIKNGDFGVIHLNSYPYTLDYEKEEPDQMQKGYLIYHDRIKFLERVNIWVTFLSGNVVNKTMVAERINSAEFFGTNLPQLIWILTAILQAEKNVYVEEYAIAFKSDNTGGYQLCQVFGININKIFDSFIQRGIPPRYFKIINKKILHNFFPHFILSLKQQNNGSKFVDEDYYKTLYPVFRKYAAFWLVVVPVIKLPRVMASFWFKCMSKLFQFIERKPVTVPDARL